MIRVVKTELYKLKRYHILWAGVALMLLSVLLTLFTSLANDGSVWDYAYLSEQTDDTLKNILTVPVSFQKLISGKLIVGGFISLMPGVVCNLFTIATEIFAQFPGFTLPLAIQSVVQISAVVLEYK